MNLLINKAADASGKPVALEDLILTTSLPTTGGSMMLDGYMSLFDAEVVGKLADAGFSVIGKTNVGEFGFDLLGGCGAGGRGPRRQRRAASCGGALASRMREAHLRHRVAFRHHRRGVLGRDRVRFGEHCGGCA